MFVFFYKGCDVCQDESITVCKTHGTEHSKPLSTTDTTKEHKLSSAIASFPDEVQLCRSSIPGSKYGVVTKCHIPKGTWLGPYEGTKVRPEVVTLGSDATYMWEVGSGPGMVWREDGGGCERKFGSLSLLRAKCFQIFKPLEKKRFVARSWSNNLIRHSYLNLS